MRGLLSPLPSGHLSNRLPTVLPFSGLSATFSSLASLVLGQQQGVIRKDDDPNFMSLVLLGIYAQAMLTALSGGPVNEDDIKRLIRIVIEGISEQSWPSAT